MELRKINDNQARILRKLSEAPEGMVAAELSKGLGMTRVGASSLITWSQSVCDKQFSPISTRFATEGSSTAWTPVFRGVQILSIMTADRTPSISQCIGSP